MGSISGTTSDGSILMAGTLTPSGATATYQWQSATSVSGVYTNIPGATSITYTLTFNDVGKYIKVTATGSESYSGTITSTATSVVTSPWIAGVSPLSANTYVYNQDSSPAQWQTSTTQCLSPQCTIIGYDDPYLSASNGVDFSNYPARNVCKSLGGRLPDVNELRNVMSGRASYGNNFTDSTYYWSATETAYFYYSNYNNAVGVITTSNANLLQLKTTPRPFRCVRDI